MSQNKNVWRGNRIKSPSDFVQLSSELKKNKLLEVESSRCSSRPTQLAMPMSVASCQVRSRCPQGMQGDVRQKWTALEMADGRYAEGERPHHTEHFTALRPSQSDVQKTFKQKRHKK